MTIICVTGEHGAGKTVYSAFLTDWLTKHGRKVALIGEVAPVLKMAADEDDLDIVIIEKNPTEADLAEVRELAGENLLTVRILREPEENCSVPPNTEVLSELLVDNFRGLDNLRDGPAKVLAFLLCTVDRPASKLSSLFYGILKGSCCYEGCRCQSRVKNHCLAKTKS